MRIIAGVRIQPHLTFGFSIHVKENLGTIGSFVVGDGIVNEIAFVDDCFDGLARLRDAVDDQLRVDIFAFEREGLGAG